MLKEFREFIARGNVIDMAVGIVVGLAFGAIVTSFVNDIVMPPIGLLLAKVDFANLYVNLSGGHYASLEEAKAAGAAAISYGVFIMAIINFVIIAFVMFLMVKQVNRLRRSEAPPAPPETKDCPFCFTAIPVAAVRCPNCTSELPPR